MSRRIVWNAVYFAVCGLWVFVVLVVTAQPLHAYVDPGSGLLFIQAAGSTMAGVAYLLRSRIRGFFRRLIGRSDDTRGTVIR